MEAMRRRRRATWAPGLGGSVAPWRREEREREEAEDRQAIEEATTSSGKKSSSHKSRAGTGTGRSKPRRRSQKQQNRAQPVDDRLGDRLARWEERERESRQQRLAANLAQEAVRDKAGGHRTIDDWSESHHFLPDGWYRDLQVEEPGQAELEKAWYLVSLALEVELFHEAFISVPFLGAAAAFRPWQVLLKRRRGVVGRLDQVGPESLEPVGPLTRFLAAASPRFPSTYVVNYASFTLVKAKYHLVVRHRGPGHPLNRASEKKPSKVLLKDYLKSLPGAVKPPAADPSVELELEMEGVHSRGTMALSPGDGAVVDTEALAAVNQGAVGEAAPVPTTGSGPRSGWGRGCSGTRGGGSPARPPSPAASPPRPPSASGTRSRRPRLPRLRPSPPPPPSPPRSKLYVVHEVVYADSLTIHLSVEGHYVKRTLHNQPIGVRLASYKGFDDRKGRLRFPHQWHDAEDFPHHLVPPTLEQAWPEAKARRSPSALGADRRKRASERLGARLFGDSGRRLSRSASFAGRVPSTPSFRVGDEEPETPPDDGFHPSIKVIPPSVRRRRPGPAFASPASVQTSPSAGLGAPDDFASFPSLPSPPSSDADLSSLDDAHHSHIPITPIHRHKPRPSRRSSYTTSSPTADHLQPFQPPKTSSGSSLLPPTPDHSRPSSSASHHPR